MCFPKLQEELVFTPERVNVSKESKPPRAFFIRCRDRCVMWTNRNCWYIQTLFESQRWVEFIHVYSVKASGSVAQLLPSSIPEHVEMQQATHRSEV